MQNTTDNRINVLDQAAFTRLTKLYSTNIMDRVLAIFTYSQIAQVTKDKIGRLAKMEIEVK